MPGLSQHSGQVENSGASSASQPHFMLFVRVSFPALRPLTCPMSPESHASPSVLQKCGAYLTREALLVPRGCQFPQENKVVASILAFAFSHAPARPQAIVVTQDRLLDGSTCALSALERPFAKAFT